MKPQILALVSFHCRERTQLFNGQTLIAVPSNVGPVTMPDYPALAAQGIYYRRSDRNSRVRRPARRNVLH